jgi:formylglycine-generating enzyme required for sulfatase activity
MGRDRFGLWAEFEIKRTKQPPVAQRMRWIPPGRFLMGSPESEEGRWEAERPQHEEVVSRGFWLFDTPCTQELWTAVMGANPSKFQSPRRPVEQVSWDDCHRFMMRLAGLIPGLLVKLPCEAQWEYACRAGTETSRYVENLDEIAWHERNCGNQTHDVGEKLPNSWGLFDMLGNVWEWCEDALRDNYDSKPVEGPLAFRVFRGGAWYGPAWRARAAYRCAAHPGDRDSDLGFRCSSSESEPESSQPRPEPERSPAADASAVAKAKADRERGEGEAQGSGGLMNTLKGMVGIKPAKSKGPNPGRKPSK